MNHLRCIWFAVSITSAFVAAEESALHARPAIDPVRVLCQGLEDKDPAVRGRAARALGALGPKAEAAIPALVDLLGDDDDDVRSGAGVALIEIGKGAVPLLTTALTARKPAARVRAAEVIFHLGPVARAAVPTLIKTLKDPDELVRTEAVKALGRVGDKSAIPALVEVLEKDPDDDVRGYSAISLAHFDKHYQEVIPALTKVLETADSELRIDLGRALGQIGAPAVPALVEVVRKTKQASVRGTAIHTLSVIGGEDAKPAVPALIDALKDRDEGVRSIAVWALDQIGSDANDALPALTCILLQDRSLIVRLQAAGAMYRIDPHNRYTIPALLEGLKARDGEVRHWAASELGRLGPDARPAVRPLADALADSDADVRLSAANALRSIGPAAKEAVPALQKALGDPSEGVQYAAQMALKAILKKKEKE